MPKSLYIIDGHALIYSGYFAPMRANLTSPTGEPTKSTYIFTNTLLGLINRRKPDMLVVAMDSKDRSFRAEIYPEYKAQRLPMPEDMPVQIDRIVEILEAMNIPVLKVPNYEADDIIGTLAAKAAAEGVQTYICSKDKDMLQLLDDDVFIYDIKNDKVQDLQWLREEKGLTPAQFIDALALMGDTADNIPGVPDVGPKTAEQWISQYGSFANLYANADAIKGKRGQSLRDNKAKAELSRVLVEISRDCPIEFVPEDFALADYNKDKLTEIFYQLGFQKLLVQMGATASADELKDNPKLAQPALFDTGNALSSMASIDHAYKLIDTPEKLNDFVLELKEQKIFAIDTETTSIESMRAKLVGISISWQEFTGYYIPVKSPFGQSCLDLSLVRELLGPILSDDTVKKIGQNLKYDIPVLQNAGLPLAGVSFDTMIASYVLHAERDSNSMDAMARDYLSYECQPISDLIGKGKKQTTFDTIETSAACDYAAEDADITFRLYKYLSPKLESNEALKKLFDELEMPLMLVLTKMEMEGVSIDGAVLRKMGNEMADKIESLRDAIYAQTGVVFNIESPKQLSEVLFDRLSLPTIKKRSTDASVLEKLADFHPVIGNIQQFRQLVKLKGTYIDKLGVMVNPATSRLHCSFNQTVTATGRLSSSNPNLQNIPIRTPEGKLIRSAFVPAKADGAILSADYSQVELRLLAHLSGDEGLLDAFNQNKDIHSFVASQVFGVPEEQVDSEMRGRAKAVNFGVIYGQGAYALSQSLGIPQSEAKRFIDDYFTRYSSIKSFMESVIAEAIKTGYASTILGRRRLITGIDSKSKMEKNSAERMAFNTTIQGSAADLIKVAMLNVQKAIDSGRLDAKMIIQIHDELVFEMPEDKAEKNSEIIKEIMENAIELTVNLKVDLGWGKNWMTGH